jgi:hypothetical protein
MIGSCLALPDLGERDRRDMFALLDRCFSGVSWPRFLADLEAKDRVVVLREDGRLAGFSTFTVRPARAPDGKTASVLCSGDTIVDPRHWGSSALGKTLIASAWDLHRRSERESFWWLLITSGPRTWGVLPTFFKTFHPAPDAPEDARLARWLGSLCEERWPGRWDAERGIIRLEHPQRLKAPLDTLPATRVRDRGVNWYVAANPGWLDGDEFPSLARIDGGNLTRAGWRYLSEYLEPRGRNGSGPLIPPRPDEALAAGD